MTRRTAGCRTRDRRWAMKSSLGIVFILFAMSSSVIWNQAKAQDSDTAQTDVPQNITRPLNVGKIPSEPYGVWLALGNPFRYLFAATSVFVVWLTIERLVVLRHGRVIPRHFVKRFFEHLREGNLDQKSAIKLCEENGSPIALVLANGVRKWGKSSVEVEQAIIDGGERQISQLRKHIRALNGAATISPLLGLLGTVMGMIKSFNDISLKSAMGKSEELAGGIGLSLLTTAAGLAIAIPSLVMYMYFSSRVDGLVVEMDAKAQELVDYISAEGLAEQARASAKAGAAKPEPRRAV